MIQMKEMKKIKLTIEKATGKKLTSPHRDRDHVYARTIYFKLCRERTHKTLKEIGESIGKKLTSPHRIVTGKHVVTVAMR